MKSTPDLTNEELTSIIKTHSMLIHRLETQLKNAIDVFINPTIIDDFKKNEPYLKNEAWIEEAKKWQYWPPDGKPFFDKGWSAAIDIVFKYLSSNHIEKESEQQIKDQADIFCDKYVRYKGSRPVARNGDIGHLTDQ